MQQTKTNFCYKSVFDIDKVNSHIQDNAQKVREVSGATLAQTCLWPEFKISRYSSKQTARKTMCRHLMAGPLNDLNLHLNLYVGCLNAYALNADEVEKCVFIDVINDARLLVQHVREKILENNEDYTRALFVICRDDDLGSNQFHKAYIQSQPAHNYLNCALIASADGVTQGDQPILTGIYSSKSDRLLNLSDYYSDNKKIEVFDKLVKNARKTCDLWGDLGALFTVTQSMLAMRQIAQHLQ